MEFGEKVLEKFDKLRNVFAAKNHDYGNSVDIIPVLATDVSPEKAVRVRISDKINRLLTLLNQNTKAKVNESIIDTMEDTAVYFIILACLWEKYMTDPLAPCPKQSQVYDLYQYFKDKENEDNNAATTPDSAYLPLALIKDSVTYTKPNSVDIGGKRYNVHTWKAALVLIAKKLITSEADKEALLQKFGPDAPGRTIVSANRKDCIAPAHITKGIYMDTCFSANSCIKTIKDFVKLLGKNNLDIRIGYHKVKNMDTITGIPEVTQDAIDAAFTELTNMSAAELEKLIEAADTINDNQLETVLKPEEICISKDEPTALANIDAKDTRLKVLNLGDIPFTGDRPNLEGIEPFCLIINGIPKHEHDLDYAIGDIYNSLHLTKEDKDTILMLQEGYISDKSKPFVARTLEELNYSNKQDVLELGDLFINMKFGSDYFNLLFLKQVMDELNKRADGIVLYYLQDNED